MSGRYRAGGTECVGVELGICKWQGHLFNGRGTNGCAQNFLHQENCMTVTEAEDNWGHSEHWRREVLSQRGRTDWQTAAHWWPLSFLHLSADMSSEISLQNCRAPRSPPGYHLLDPASMVQCPWAGLQAQKSTNVHNTNLIALTFHSYWKTVVFVKLRNSTLP